MGLTRFFDGVILIPELEQGGEAQVLNTNALKGKIVANGYTQQQVASAMNLSLNTISSKINGKKAFTLPEVERLCSILKIDDPLEKCSIFLP